MMFTLLLLSALHFGCHVEGVSEYHTISHFRLNLTAINPTYDESNLP